LEKIKLILGSRKSRWPVIIWNFEIFEFLAKKELNLKSSVETSEKQSRLREYSNLLEKPDISDEKTPEIMSLHIVLWHAFRISAILK